MKIFRKTALAAAMVATFGMSAQASADVETNIGVTSNYIWRGVTQTADQAAVSGGLDYTSGGFYLGTWASNVDFSGTGDGYELDFYGGFSGSLGGAEYDLGYIYYAYPSIDDSDFSEIYLNGTFGMFNAGIAYMIDADFSDQNYLYINAGVDFELTPDYGLSLYVGNYDLDGDTVGAPAEDSYTHFGAALSKGDFTLAVDKNDINGGNADDPRVSVSWSKTF